MNKLERLKRVKEDRDKLAREIELGNLLAWAATISCIAVSFVAGYYKAYLLSFMSGGLAGYTFYGIRTEGRAIKDELDQLDAGIEALESQDLGPKD